ncbi:MAG: UDP-N-acetylmuramyl pentapeptide phosphotransferase [Desulfotignum sp.]|nr:UDP-N-acetylmuramyl pentapeptide phosphotransferase [Desulfobacteraceae bacterium]
MKYGAAIGAIDRPSKRSSHQNNIPKGGGFGILAALVFSSLILKIPVFIWIPALVISLASFWGADKYILPVSQRLLIHFGCGLIFLVFFLNAKQAVAVDYVVWLPVLVFIVGTANFYNFMDGIDGIAGIAGFVAFLLVSFHAQLSGMDQAYVSLGLGMAFSCLGFLCFNIPRAKVFLGDVGSILLGFVFASLIVFLSRDLADFMVMAGFLAPFYFDELFTMVVRIKNKDSLIEPHRKHIYQVLVNEAGIGHWKVSLGYGMMQLIIGFSAIFAQPEGVFHLFGMYVFYGLMFAVFSIIIRKRYSWSEN